LRVNRLSNLETERLILRKLTTEDSEQVESLASDYDVAKTTLTIPHPYPKGSAKEFISNINKAQEEEKIVIYAITKKDDSSLIGIINLSLQKIYDRAELAYWVGKPYWGKGYGTEAAKALLEYGFEELNLNRIFAASFTNNPGSWRIMEKIGLKHEGVLRQHLKKREEYVDLTYYGLIKEEYFRNR
jgi:[ribosomal protein S5]-alanine N-acetyltransferase